MHQLFCKQIEKERDEYKNYERNRNYLGHFTSIRNRIKTPLNFRDQHSIHPNNR